MLLFRKVLSQCPPVGLMRLSIINFDLPPLESFFFLSYPFIKQQHCLVLLFLWERRFRLLAHWHWHSWLVWEGIFLVFHLARKVHYFQGDVTREIYFIFNIIFIGIQLPITLGGSCQVGLGKSESFPVSIQGTTKATTFPNFFYFIIFHLRVYTWALQCLGLGRIEAQVSSSNTEHCRKEFCPPKLGPSSFMLAKVCLLGFLCWFSYS